MRAAPPMARTIIHDRRSNLLSLGTQQPSEIKYHELQPHPRDWLRIRWMATAENRTQWFFSTRGFSFRLDKLITLPRAKSRAWNRIWSYRIYHGLDTGDEIISYKIPSIVNSYSNREPGIYPKILLERIYNAVLGLEGRLDFWNPSMRETGR